MNIDDIKIYLPKYLSAESEKELFNGLKDFPYNIDERLYTTYLKDKEIIFQGDGLNDMLVVNLPKSEIRPAPSIILSNTCDIDIQNIRNFPSQIVYTPIFNLEKYKKSIIKNSTKTKEQINSHITSIKRQEVTQIFYLPKWGSNLAESIVFLDRVNNVSSNSIQRNSVPSKRIFTLSDYGAYLFLLKLSIHYTRIQDRVDRKSTFI
jgi:hypothetical protein